MKATIRLRVWSREKSTHLVHITTPDIDFARDVEKLIRSHFSGHELTIEIEGEMQVNTLAGFVMPTANEATKQIR